MILNFRGVHQRRASFIEVIVAFRRLRGSFFAAGFTFHLFEHVVELEGCRFFNTRLHTIHIIFILPDNTIRNRAASSRHRKLEMSFCDGRNFVWNLSYIFDGSSFHLSSALKILINTLANSRLRSALANFSDVGSCRRSRNKSKGAHIPRRYAIRYCNESTENITAASRPTGKSMGSLRHCFEVHLFINWAVPETSIEDAQATREVRQRNINQLIQSPGTLLSVSNVASKIGQVNIQ